MAAGKPSPPTLAGTSTWTATPIASEAEAGAGPALPTRRFLADSYEAPETRVSAAPGMTATPLPILASDRGGSVR
ncbi:MAG: hypothetical protein OXI91_01590 [Chloroflexota bacterium]|nr:hypothetical protein [Chloroflexota bacterium]